MALAGPTTRGADERSLRPGSSAEDDAGKLDLQSAERM